MERDRLVSRSRGPETSGPSPAPKKKRSRPQLDNLAAAAGPGRRTRRDLERESNDASARASRGDMAVVEGREHAAPAVLPAGGGRPLRPEIRDIAERGLGIDAAGVRVHDDRDARLTASALGARAFADGSNIWLGPGASEADRELMAHELAHVAQGEPGLYLRSATWIERRAWLSWFDHYLPRKFLNNYMDDTGAAITLTNQEMIDVNPIVNIRVSPGFATELAALQAQARTPGPGGTPAPAIKFIQVSGPGQAMTNGTLGNFTIHYKGLLTVNPDGTWVFAGSMTFYDLWDFDPKPFGTSGRSTAGELKTRVAANFLPGSPFEIFSVSAPCVQTGTDRRAAWAGGAPKFVGDQASRTGADIEVGAGGGEALGPVGETGGGEVGAQSSEDLNP